MTKTYNFINEEITKRLDLIKNTNDDEAQHDMEDELYAYFIRIVSKLEESEELSKPELSELAKLVLTSQNIEFYRWCA
jgi:hypothetical protein